MSRVIFKMTFKHPNLKDTNAKNVAHVNYIATRPGADKTLTEADLNRELSKGIQLAMSTDDDYAKYIDERPGSHGLFGKDGAENLIAVQNELEAHASYVWRGIVSLREGDAKELDYMRKEKWQDLLNKKMPDMAKEMNIRIDNMRWVAAVHMEKGHPHAHIMLWEKDPERTLGTVSTKVLDNIRKHFTDEIFEEERFNLLQQKNTLRDLIRDLANNDVGQAARLVREVRDSEIDIKAMIQSANVPGVAPKLYDQDALILADKVKRLAELLPGRGRMAFKLMPDNVKAEARAIADYILAKPEFSAALAKNLKAVEELTGMYTGKEDATKTAVDNAYKDIRDRICQIIIKGAVESGKNVYLHVDQDLADKAVNVVKGIDSQINLNPERIRVFNHVGNIFIKAGHSDEQISKFLQDFSDRESFGYSNEFIQQLVTDLHKESNSSFELSLFNTSNKMDIYLSTLKLAGYAEEEAYNHIKSLIAAESIALRKELNELQEKGLITEQSGIYKLTENGMNEYLKGKELDTVQKEIIKAIETESSADYSKLFKVKDIASNLSNKDPEAFKLGKYDLKVQEYFGDENSTTLKQIEATIYDRTTDTEKAENEFGAIKYRIEKLFSYGYISIDRDTGIMSMTEKTIEELKTVKEEMEFSRYDVNVTLTYIDKAEGGILKAEDLEKQLYSEIVNKSAEEHYSRFTELMEDIQSREYINIDEEGNITATEAGKKLSFELGEINSYFTKAKGLLTEEKLTNICKEEFQEIKQQITVLSSHGFIRPDEEGNYKLTEKGSEEYLKVKGLDKAQLEILKTVSSREANELDSILTKENVFEKLYDKDPEEFKIKKYDHKVREEFGKSNKLYLQELEARIYEKYNMESPEEMEKAKNEYLILKGRIENLTLNGYVDYDSEGEYYSFTKEGLDELKALKDEMEYSRYDANITLSYIDRAGNGILDIKDLKDTIFKEVVNQTAKGYYEAYNDYMINGTGNTYIRLNAQENLTATEAGKRLSYELGPLMKYFNTPNRLLTQEQLDKLCKKEFGSSNWQEQRSSLIQKIEKQVENGHIIKNEDNSYKMVQGSFNFAGLSYQIYKAGGSIPQDKVKETLEKNVPNFEAEKHFKYIYKRLEYLKDEGYLEGPDNQYWITKEGVEKRKDLLVPERVYLKKEIAFLEKLGFLQKAGSDYITTQKCQDYLTRDEANEGKKVIKGSYFMNKQAANLVEKTLDNIKLSKIEPKPRTIKRLMNKIKVQVTRGNVLRLASGEFSIEPFKKDIRNFMHQIYKEGGSIIKDNLKSVLEKNIPNYGAERQYSYLIKRLDFLKKEGYVAGLEGQYQITTKGEEKRKDLQQPERVYLRKELNYLQKLGFVKLVDGEYRLTEKYNKHMAEVAQAKKDGVDLRSSDIKADVAKVIDKFYGNVDIDKMERHNNSIALGKYLNKEYENIKTDYKSVREHCRVPDHTERTINNVAKILLVSGISAGEAYNILLDWNTKSNSNLDPEKLNEIVEKVNKIVESDKLFGKTTVISKDDWTKTFIDLGIKEPPEWIYKGTGGMNMFSILNTIWKAAWAQAEKARLQTEAEVAHLQKKLFKQQNLNKEAIKEKVRESKSNTLFKDQDLER